MAVRGPGQEHRSYRDAKDGQKKSNPWGLGRKDALRCYECNGSGHIAAYYPSIRCLESGERGHFVSVCPLDLQENPRTRTNGGKQPQNEMS